MMKNPFPNKLMIYSLQDGHLVNAGAGNEFTREEADFIGYVINNHETNMELLRLCREVIDDNLEERPARHSLGNLHARLRAAIAASEVK